MTAKSDLPQGALDLPILKTAVLGPIHGYAAAEWKETETGREAKFYRLSRKGRAQLEMEAAGRRRLTKAVSPILKMSEGGAQ